MEDKTAKYVKYAVGEIFLVVIGILIALQINNWNENRKQKAKVNSYLKSMVVDLKSDIKAYDRIARNYQHQVDANSTIFKNKNYQELPIDTILSKITSFYASHHIVDQTYQKIKNSGLANNLGSTDLNDAINDYYSNGINPFITYSQFDKERSTLDDDLWFLNNNFESNIAHPFAKHIYLPYSESEEDRKKAIISTIESNIGRNHLRHNIFRKLLGIEIVKTTRTNADSLVRLISKELNQDSL